MANYLENAEDIDFVTKTAIERDPNKRRVKPVETQASILDFELEDESSDDSDFRIEDHPEVSDDDDDDDINDGNGGDDDGDSVNSSSDDHEDGGGRSGESDLDELKNLNLPNGNGLSISDLIQQANLQFHTYNEKDSQLLICCGCLGDQSDSVNEIVECDSCGVTVHEACYGISDTASLGSSDSLSPTAPWFCESCKAGVKDPICELCPNNGGIFKETDVGKWIHLVCALYVPGVAFGEVDKLTSVTLFEMPYSKWGAKSCSLCTDERFARTGVCIGCDAGMCKTYFHVTCAQREGFLSEAHSEEVDQADPFYAHCKLHSDKTLVKRRKRNYLALQLRTHYRKLQFEKDGHLDTPEQQRIQRKLCKQRMHFIENKSLKPAPWVPTQKMPRLLTTSASACRRLLRKAELMGINTMVLEMQEAQAAALVDVRKKWHIPPAFTVEFIAYYLDRNDRLKSMKDTLEKLLDDNRKLLDEQHLLRTKYDELLKINSEESKKNNELKQMIHKYHSAILSACPTKNLPNIDDLGKPQQQQQQQVRQIAQPMMVPTAAALKMGVGFPLNNIPAGRTDRVLSSHAKQESLMLNECGICRQKRDQHLLAKCDTCHLYYHLNCLNPPLTRLPKKSKLYGWQCSECDKTSDSEIEQIKTPRRSKSRYSRDFKNESLEHSSSSITTTITTTPTTTTTPKLKIKPLEPEYINQQFNITQQQQQQPQQLGEVLSTNDVNNLVQQQQNMDNGVGHVSKSSKKRRREKHKNRYSPELGNTSSSREHKRKRKKKSIDHEQPSPPHPRITIKIKPIPLPAGEIASESNPQCFYVPNENNDNAPPPPPLPPIQQQQSVSIKVVPPLPEKSTSQISSCGGGKVTLTTVEICDVCQTEAISANSVRCDDCQKNYHFTCLDPPLKKTPKKRGYSWHCADCDPTASE